MKKKKLNQINENEGAMSTQLIGIERYVECAKMRKVKNKQKSNKLQNVYTGLAKTIPHSIIVFISSEKYLKK
jgi:GTP-binding protein EngB required for normal cell division